MYLWYFIEKEENPVGFLKISVSVWPLNKKETEISVMLRELCNASQHGSAPVNYGVHTTVLYFVNC